MVSADTWEETQDCRCGIYKKGEERREQEGKENKEEKEEDKEQRSKQRCRNGHNQRPVALGVLHGDINYHDHISRENAACDRSLHQDGVGSVPGLIDMLALCI